jgi:hypothetical protein
MADKRGRYWDDAVDGGGDAGARTASGQERPLASTASTASGQERPQALKYSGWTTAAAEGAAPQNAEATRAAAGSQYVWLPVYMKNKQKERGCISF